MAVWSDLLELKRPFTSPHAKNSPGSASVVAPTFIFAHSSFLPLDAPPTNRPKSTPLSAPTSFFIVKVTT